MRIEINRDECPNRPAELSDCVRCVERFINYPVQYERHCFKVIEAMDFDEVSIKIHSEPPAVKEAVPAGHYPISHTDWIG